MTREPPMKDTSGRPDIVDEDGLVSLLIGALHGMVVNFRPFTLRPIGSEGSRARAEQEEQNAAHREACRVLDIARRNPNT